MKKSELKNIIKECIKEVIFEDGVLSGLITEVAQGLHGSRLQEVSSPRSSKSPVTDIKKQVMSEVAKNSYSDIKEKFSNPQLFEGTEPIPGGSGQGALSGVSPNDSGVDISNIPGFSNWGSVANNLK
jgi:hypothetical protein